MGVHEGLLGGKPHSPPNQFAEKGPVDSSHALTDYIIGRGTGAARQATRDLASDILDKLPQSGTLRIPGVMETIEDAVKEHSVRLREILEDTTLAGKLGGESQAAKAVGNLLSGRFGGGRVTLPPVDELFGREPHVRFPTIDAAVSKLESSPVAAGTDYHATAAEVQRGAFAITGDLEAETVADIRDALTKNLAEGANFEDFRKDVAGLFEEGTGFSEARLNQIFRTNVGQAMADSQEEALARPVVADAFPYRQYVATRDQRVRPEHLALETAGLNGTSIYAVDDPAWKAFRPPWDYGCRCTSIPVTVRQAAEDGVREAKDWWSRAERIAEQRGGGEPEEYLHEVMPASREFVSWPTLNGKRIEPSAFRAMQFAEDGPKEGDRRKNPRSGKEEELRGGKWHTVEGGEKEASEAEIGPHGPILREFHHDAQGAIEKLKELEDGEAIGALHHKRIGDIDLVWGSAGDERGGAYGLAHVIDEHPDVVPHLQSIIDNSRIHKTEGNRVVLRSRRYQSVIQLQWEGKEKRWLVTAFDKQKKDAS